MCIVLVDATLSSRLAVRRNCSAAALRSPLARAVLKMLYLRLDAALSCAINCSSFLVLPYSLFCRQRMSHFCLLKNTSVNNFPVHSYFQYLLFRFFSQPVNPLGNIFEPKINLGYFTIYVKGLGPFTLLLKGAGKIIPQFLRNVVIFYFIRFDCPVENILRVGDTSPS